MPALPTTTSAWREWLRAAAVYREPRVIAVIFLGFASGLPLLLTASTLAIRLTEAGVDLKAIGLFALVGVPYTLKFLWAPLMDRLRLPLLTDAFGRRRGWILLTQFGLIAALLGLGSADPAQSPAMTALLAVIVAFCSASQDIVIDAFRVEILEERQQGAGAAAIVFGYRVAILVSGAGALYLATGAGWFWTYAVMGALMLVGVATVLLTPEPAARPSADTVEREQRVGRFLARRPSLPHWAAETAVWIYGAVVAPFADFMRRRGWLAILAFILLYKFGDALAGVLANPFYIKLGFTKIEIANISKLYGLLATLGGGFMGGMMVSRWGIMSSLLVAGVLQMLSNLMFAVQAVVGHDVGMLMVTISVENLSGGMGTAAFVAYLSSLCNVAYTATQYALLSSLMSVARTTFSAPAGWLVESLDWVGFFLFTTVAALPGLLLLLWMIRRFPAPQRVADAPAE